MNAQPIEALIEKLKALPPEQRAEVEELARLEPPLTEAEIDAEVAAARADRARRR